MILDRIIQGNVLDVAKDIPSELVQTVVTSPPYWGLRDYGVAGQIGLEETPEAYIQNMVQVFGEVRRILRPDGTLWLNLGDAYNGYMANQRATSLSANNQESRPRFAPGHGRRTTSLTSKDLIGLPWRVALALQADGWILRSDIIWAKKNCMPESVTDRPTRTHEYIFLMSKSPRYFYDADAIKERCSESYLNDGRHERGSNQAHIKEGYAESGAQDPKGPHRLFKKRNPRPGIDSRGGGQGSGEMSYPADRRNKRTVWTVATKPFSEAHFATFPEDLIEPCILAGAAAGQVVFDPFMGAGTTGLVAARHRRRFLGIELNPDYVQMARRRIAPELQQAKLDL